SPYYDSLVAKLIGFGQTRMEAIKRMQRALAEFEIKGVETTLSLHQKILGDPDFQRGKFTTKYMQEKMDKFNTQSTGSMFAQEHKPEFMQGEEDQSLNPEIVAVMAAAIAAYGEAGKDSFRIVGIKPINKSCSPWRLAGLYELLGR
ncbi:MAG: acetyl-CoA carboxylase biotin carboxylase subunit, partial [Desulfitobacteriaceae bacterium]